MAIRPRDFSTMVNDSLEYLLTNTSITFTEQGGIARGLVDASNLEISRLQDFVAVNYENSFLSIARGPFLDLFGDYFGLPRKVQTTPRVFKEDGAIRFYIKTGVLGTRLPDPKDNSKGLIPAGTTISNAEGTVRFATDVDITFPFNKRSVFVSARATTTGTNANVGANLLAVHNLSAADVFVTNDIAITNGADLESDNDYRFRLVNAFSTRFSSNSSAVSVAALSVPGVVRADLVQFARGAGTYDILLVPRGNKLSRSVKEQAERAIDSVTAYGISGRVREPDYIPVKLTIRLRFAKGTTEGVKSLAKEQAQTSVLNYLGNISLGGELIINQLRANVLSASSSIIDLSVLELCIDGIPQSIRNYQLEEDELFTPDEEREAVIIL